MACLALGILPFACSFARAETLRLCYESTDIRPWVDMQGRGLNVSLLTLAARSLNLEFSYEGLPWKRCLAMLANNEVDGAFAASFKTERLELGVYPGPLGHPDAAKRLHFDRYLLVRRKGDTLDWDGKQFQNLNGILGAQLGYSIVDQVRAMGVEVDERSGNAQDLLRKLQGGRVAGALMLAGELAALQAESPVWRDGFEVVPRPVAEKPYFLMLSRRLVETRPEQAKAIWNAIENKRKSAEYQALEKQALGTLGGN